MASVLDESDLDDEIEEFDEKNPLCWTIKCIIKNLEEETTSKSSVPKQSLPDSDVDPLGVPFENQIQTSQYEKFCRNNDPFMIEVNRLIFCPTHEHPPSDSPEYYQIAENYALYGKEFLDFPRDFKCSHCGDTNIFMGEVRSQAPSTSKAQPPSGFGLQLVGSIKSTKQIYITSNALQQQQQQQQNFVNQANYWNQAYVQAQSAKQQLVLTNPAFVAQYLSTILQENHIKVSLAQQQQQQQHQQQQQQQQQVHISNIQDWVIYAQMLQQQKQMNQTQLMGASCITSGTNTIAKSKHDILEFASLHGKDINDNPKK